MSALVAPAFVSIFGAVSVQPEHTATWGRAKGAHRHLADCSYVIGRAPGQVVQVPTDRLVCLSCTARGGR